MEIIKYLKLPGQISEFESQYLSRLNRVAYCFLLAHLVVIPVVAWACGTGPWSALAMTGFVLSGTTLAFFTLRNPRFVSMLFGATSMLIGGLLVHFGQGPVQIEMHFYFFAMLAMLCMFANPAVNLTAAVTVALHHALGWWLLPDSLFNYDAAWWVVAVHAGFVVMETVGCCFIARTFFDNVMGLEKKVQARTQELESQKQGMQTVLDNVQQGLAVVRSDGMMTGEPSRALVEWFGEAPPTGSLLEWMQAHSPKFSQMLELGLEMVGERVMPMDIALAQMPSRLDLGDRQVEFAFQAVRGEAVQVGEDDPIELLMVVTDITERLAAQAEGRRHADLLAVFRHIMNDQVAFLEFLSEAESIMAVLTTRSYGDVAHFKRLVHTVKGNAAVFGMRTVSSAADALESTVADHGSMPEDSQIETLLEAWTTMRSDLEQLLGDRESSGISVDDREYEAVLRAMLDDNIDRSRVASMVRSWRLEPSQDRLDRVAQQLERIAGRLSKEVQVQVEGNGIRLDREHFASFWSALVHVSRNTVDHGIESTQEREAAGKTPVGQIVLSTALVDGNLVVGVQDDGRGIDVERLRARAADQGMDGASSMSMEALIFADGLSSRDQVSDISGRGVGAAAVREACEALGGRVQVESTPGNGTRFSFVFPDDETVYPGHEAALDEAAA